MRWVESEAVSLPLGAGANGDSLTLAAGAEKVDFLLGGRGLSKGLSELPSELPKGSALPKGSFELSLCCAIALLGEPNLTSCGHMAIVKTTTKNAPIEKVMDLIIHLRLLRLCTV